MAKIKQILAPTDCSDISKDAVNYAMELVETSNAKLTLLNIVSPSSLIDELSDPNQVYQQMIEEAKYQRKRKFDEFWKSVKRPGINANLIQIEGDPFTEIMRYTEKEAQDLIVMATHGTIGLMHIMMGSVAEKMVRYSRFPVLIVKHGDIGYEAA